MQRINRRNFLQVSAQSAIALLIGRVLHLRAAVSFVEFLWSGAITENSARINARIDHESTTVQCHVSTNSDLSNPLIFGVFVADTAVNNRIVSIPITNLTPDTQYYYAIESGGVLDDTKQGQFKNTAVGAFSFQFVLGSCAQNGSNHPVFDTIRNLNPLFFLHGGDLHYQNIDVNNKNIYRAAYDTVLNSPNQAALHRQTPIVYMWDDHDFGPNDSNETAPGRQAARLTYQEYVPHYPLSAGSGDVPIYQSFAIGRTYFILTDLRSERSPKNISDNANKTMMGATQKAWFKNELLMARDHYVAIFWLSTVPWIGTAVSGNDNWAGYTTERAELANFIKNSWINNLVILCGDAHMIALDDGTNSNYATEGGTGFPVFHAGSLDREGSIKGGSYTHGTFPGGGQFGLITIVDSGGNDLSITLSGRDFNNNVIVESTFVLSFHPLDKDLFLPVILQE